MDSLEFLCKYTRPYLGGGVCIRDINGVGLARIGKLEEVGSINF